MKVAGNSVLLTAFKVEKVGILSPSEFLVTESSAVIFEWFPKNRLITNFSTNFSLYKLSLELRTGSLLLVELSIPTVHDNPKLSSIILL